MQERVLRSAPLVRGALVPRPHLVARLREAATPVVLLVAPAGYGKTTLLRAWDAADERPFTWIGAGASAETPLDEIAVEPGGVLVLDDAHLVRAPHEIAALQTLAEQLPASTQLALAARADPPLALGRLRAHRRLTELRTPQLVMGAAEGAALLERAGLRSTAGEAELLVQRTEGWPACLYLAALCVGEQRNRAEALARFGGDDRVVAAYLCDELLAGLTQAQLRLLVHSSIAQSLSGPLCDALLATSGSGRLLAELADANVLLALDRAGEHYRCHRLLGELLLSELRRSEPQRESLLRTRASAWYAAHGDVDRAIDQAAAAGDAEQAGALLWAHAAHYAGDGRNAALARWLERFEPECIAASPTLALTAATSRLAAGDLARVEQWTAAAAVALEARPSADASLTAGLAAMRVALVPAGVARMARDAERAATLAPPDSAWHALCCLLGGAAAYLSGDETGRARALLEEGARRGALAAPLVQALCLAQLALLAMDEGDRHTAVLLATRAGAQLDARGLSRSPAAALVFAAAAAVRAQRGRVEEAERDARHAERLLGAPSGLAPWYEAETRIALARAALRLSDVGGARRLLAEAARLACRDPSATLLASWLGDLSAQADAAAEAAIGGGWSLTTAELRVLQLLPTHHSYPAIARRLQVSPNTVKTHARAVYRKLDACSRAEAVGRARDAGLLDVAEAA